MSHYDALGVDPKATAAEIRKAYLTRARRVHPDFHTGDDAATRAEAEQQMRALNEAWAVLGDDDRRRAYDQGLDDRRADRRRTDQWSTGQRSTGQRSAGRPPTRRATRPTGAASPDFVPYSDDDTDYAALLDEAGPGNGATIPRAVQLAPVVLFGVSVFAFSAGLVTGLSAVYAVAIVCLVLSGVSFLLTPALAVMRSLDSERD
ncbi:MAG: J domain-containing protein [Acidimicrobiales bacterium]